MTNRNQAWLPIIQRLAEEGGGDAFVVVGAAHLVGEDGLIRQLSQRGLRVRQLQERPAVAVPGP